MKKTVGIGALILLIVGGIIVFRFGNFFSASTSSSVVPAKDFFDISIGLARMKSVHIPEEDTTTPIFLIRPTPAAFDKSLLREPLSITITPPRSSLFIEESFRVSVDENNPLILQSPDSWFYVGTDPETFLGEYVVHIAAGKKTFEHTVSLGEIQIPPLLSIGAVFGRDNATVSVEFVDGVHSVYTNILGNMYSIFNPTALFQEAVAAAQNPLILPFQWNQEEYYEILLTATNVVFGEPQKTAPLPAYPLVFITQTSFIPQ